MLVEADYHMKLIGMGLAEGVDGVESYLKSIHLRPGESPPAMSVLRWWFTLNYDTIARSEANDAFELVGQGVRVLSENEMLAEQGQRVHTGQSDPLNRQFAESFTRISLSLSKKYPVYGELRNMFDLAMAVAMIQSEGLAEKVGWKPTLLANGDEAAVAARQCAARSGDGDQSPRDQSADDSRRRERRRDGGAGRRIAKRASQRQRRHDHRRGCAGAEGVGCRSVVVGCGHRVQIDSGWRPAANWAALCGSAEAAGDVECFAGDPAGIIRS